MRQPVLFQLQLDRSHVVELFSHSRLSSENLELQIGVGQHGDHVTNLDQRSVLHKNLFNSSTFDCVQVDRAAGDEAAPQRYEVLKRADRHGGNSYPLCVDAQAAPPHEHVDEPPGKQQSGTAGSDVGSPATVGGFFLDFPIHALAGYAKRTGSRFS